VKKSQIQNLSGHVSEVDPHHTAQELKNSASNPTILDLIFIIDEDGRYIEFNDSGYLKPFYTSDLKIIGERFEGIFPKEVDQSFL